MRRTWTWLALGLAAVCAACRQSAPRADLLPPTVAGVWHRSTLENVGSGDAPDPVPRPSINHLQVATYDGPGKLEARLYELDSPGVALDLVQRWRPSADTVFFYHDRYFVVLKWQDADRKALEAFARELESRLGKPKEPS